MQIGGDAVVSGLLEILQDHNTPKQGRFQAVVALMKIKDTTAVPGLLRALQQDEYSQVRRLSASALGELGGATAIPQLREALQDEDVQVRASAALSLKSIGTQEALEALKSTGTSEALQALEYGRVNLHKFTF